MPEYGQSRSGANPPAILLPWPLLIAQAGAADATIPPAFPGILWILLVLVVLLAALSLALFSCMMKHRKVQITLEQSYERLDKCVQKSSAELKQANETYDHERVERRRTEEALLRSVSLLSMTFENAGIGIALVNLDGQLFQINKRLGEMLGYRPAEMASQPLQRYINQADIDGSLAQRMADEHRDSIECQVRFIQKSGAQFWGRLTTNMVLAGQERPEFMVALIEDITEKREAEEALKDYVKEVEQLNKGMTNLLEDLQASNRLLKNTMAQLEETNQEIESFSYSVSHDLRAPLRAINGYASALMEDYHRQLDDEGRRFLDRIRQNAVNMGQLIDDLLAFSRLSRSTVSFLEIDMEEMVRSVLSGILPHPEEQNVSVNILSLPPARGDPSMIRQVWVNLLSNAIKFSQEEKKPAIEIGSRLDGPDIIYYVKDNGVGFDMRFQDKLFAIFQRLHRADEFEGTGVGLPIVQRIIHGHHGRIWAESEVGHGAVFYFTLPNREHA